MNATLAHRGPDSAGYYIRPGVGLAMRRLSIIDVAGGDQPIFNEDQSIAIIFNGEIYNFPDLRAQLVQAGHRFATDSDTECVVHAYEEWGTGCLDRLNGMFAFALWDQRECKLFLARDRTGIKPLYYADLDGTLVFGSEIKALLQYPDLPREIDYFALDEYLTFEYVPAPHSIFRAIKKLPPAHALTYQDGRVCIWPYWDLHLELSEDSAVVPRFEEMAVEFRAMFKEVVRHEMISDVPLGVLLSGGVDSSSVAALMTEISSQPVKSFSITFEDASFDEARYARLAARHLNTEHYELRMTGAMALDVLDRIPHFMDEPLADSSLVPTMLLSGLARQHVTVALGGDGGDEMLAGYSTLQAHRLMATYQHVVPGPLRQLALSTINHLPVSFDNISTDFKLKRFAGGHRLPIEVRHQTWLGSFSTAEKETVLARPLLRHWRATYNPVLNHRARVAAQNPLNLILYMDMKMYLDGDILPKVDRASMSHSLEVRVPFLNYDVLRFMERVPIDYKLRGLTTKALLRKAMENDLPRQIVDRGKKGFNMPVARWLNNDLRDWTHDLLAPDRLKRQGLFNAEGVQQLLADHMNRRRDARKQLWTLLMFQIWWDHWYVSTEGAHA